MRSLYPALIVMLALSDGCGTTRSGGGSSTVADANTQKQLAHTLVTQERYQEAIEVLKPLSQSRTIDPQIHSLLGKSYWKIGEYDKAVKSFESALRLDYADASAHRDFGQMLMEDGKVGRALTEFELAIRFGDRDALSHYNYGLALYEFGRKDAALAQWELAFSADPLNAKYAEALGIGLTGKDDLGGAAVLRDGSRAGGWRRVVSQ